MIKKLAESDLAELGVFIRGNNVQKLKPNPKTIKPLNKLLKMLNGSFGKKANKVLLSTIFYGCMPWENNESKKWYILCDSISAVYSKKTKAIEKLIRRKYPEFEFEIVTTSSMVESKKRNCTILK